MIIFCQVLMDEGQGGESMNLIRSMSFAPAVFFTLAAFFGVEADVANFLVYLVPQLAAHPEVAPLDPPEVVFLHQIGKLVVNALAAFCLFDLFLAGRGS